ncbi:hypothetical protein D9756_009190 [Leucocoprinus leucothites]|uniref:Uncharacterized protein n=1 Tax=Leucocoprinus leucothites TaxID=201217 RepID=A0A8H5FUX3_9AGAR|nr:hypothetical protein D9756_009190 [Leucoagaricus leucothites]
MPRSIRRHKTVKHGQKYTLIVTNAHQSALSDSLFIAFRRCSNISEKFGCDGSKFQGAENGNGAGGRWNGRQL